MGKYVAIGLILGGLLACKSSVSAPVADTAGQDNQVTQLPFSIAFEGYHSDIYADTTNWLCVPGAENSACATDLTSTTVHADGTLDVEPFEPNADPAIDCFYVYPTASLDPTGNSDRIAGETEIYAVLNQTARLAKLCRVFAPMYRQITLGSLFGSTQGDAELAYADVADAFKHYMANHNAGRGVALIGHSQGAWHLRVLMQKEFDGKPEMEKRLVAAYLIGSTVEVPEDADVGLTFTSLPLCRETNQTGCVVSYASFRATQPPTEDSLFGDADNGVAACNNPAALKGGKAMLTPYFPTVIPEAFQTFGIKGGHPFADPETAPDISTPYFTLPDFLEGECVRKNGFSYLEITVNANPDDPRTDDIGGDFTPEWGLHLVDVSLAMGDFLTLLTSQTAAFVGGT